MKMKLAIDGDQGIVDTIHRLEFLKDNIIVGNYNVVRALVKKGEELANKYNASAPQSTQSSEKQASVKGVVLDGGRKGYVALIGDSAVYDEFGTGEEGAANPHPLKGNYNLNPYNSGPVVSTHINPETGRHFWYYNGDVTEGIPSGKQMYNTAKDLRAEKNTIIKTEMENALKRFR